MNPKKIQRLRTAIYGLSPNPDQLEIDVGLFREILRFDKPNLQETLIRWTLMFDGIEVSCGNSKYGIVGTIWFYAKENPNEKIIVKNKIDLVTKDMNGLRKHLLEEEHSSDENHLFADNIIHLKKILLHREPTTTETFIRWISKFEGTELHLRAFLVDFEKYIRYSSQKYLFCDKSEIKSHTGGIVITIDESKFIRGDIDAFLKFLLEEVDDSEIETTLFLKDELCSVWDIMCSNWDIPRLALLRQTGMTPRRILDKYDHYHFEIIGQWVQKENDYYLISNDTPLEVMTRHINSYDVWEQSTGVRNETGWQQEPMFQIDYMYGNISNLIFSSGGEHHGIIADNLYLYLVFDPGFKSIERINGKNVFNSNYIPMCFELFEDITRNNIPELLFALAMNHKEKEFQNDIREIHSIIQSRQFHKLTPYKELFRTKDIIYNLLKSEFTPYDAKWIEVYHQFLLNLGSSWLWGLNPPDDLDESDICY